MRHRPCDGTPNGATMSLTVSKNIGDSVGRQGLSIDSPFDPLLLSLDNAFKIYHCTHVESFHEASYDKNNLLLAACDNLEVLK